VDGSQAQSATYFARISDNGTQPIDQRAWTASVNPFFGGPPGGWGELLVQLTWDNTLPPEGQTPDPYKLFVLPTDATGWPLEHPSESVLPQTHSVNVAC
jgi:hypothetical protein